MRTRQQRVLEAERARLPPSKQRKISRNSRQLPSSSSSSEEECDSDDDEVEWVGEPLVSERSSKAYHQVRVVNDTYHTGDSVLVEVEGFKEYQPLLLKELWEDADGEMWGYGTWYYLAWEVGKRGSLTNELFECDRGDEFPVLSLRKRLTVFEREKDMPDDDEGVHLCRYFFDPSTRTVVPRPEVGIKKIPGETTSTSKQSKKKRSRKGSQISYANSTHISQTDDEQSSDDGGEVSEVTGDVYDRARRMLQLSAVPDSLPCRDSERDRIHAFLYNSINRGGSQLALYISGMPGTGKTATFYEVIRSLNKLQKNGKLRRFKFIELNGLKLPNPEEAYSVLAGLILNDNTLKMSAVKASQALEHYFTTPDPKREVCVLLIDEIDQLVTKKQQLLYNIFDWPQSSHARLVVVGIANTMDLPERLLPRIQSRLGEGRIMFAPYNRKQIEQIVRQRLQGIELFDPNAIDFSALKVAGLSGDVRRALQLCRRAVEICRRNKQERVMIEHVNAAVKEIDSKLHCQVLTSLNTLEKLFIICTHKHTKAIGPDEQVFFQDVLRRIKTAAPLFPEFTTVINSPEATRGLFFIMMAKLVGLGLLKSDGELRQRSFGPALTLNFEFEDMRIALGADQLLERLM